MATVMRVGRKVCYRCED